MAQDVLYLGIWSVSPWAKCVFHFCRVECSIKILMVEFFHTFAIALVVSSVVERGVLTSPTVTAVCLFLLPFLQVLASHGGQLCCLVHRHSELLCQLHGMAFVIVTCPSLSLAILFALKPTLSDINIATFAFCQLCLHDTPCFCPCMVSLPVSLYLKQVSWGQHIVRSCFQSTLPLPVFQVIYVCRPFALNKLLMG